MESRPPVALAGALALLICAAIVPGVRVSHSEAVIAAALPMVESPALLYHVQHQQLPAVVMYGASWCPACHRIQSDLASVAMQYDHAITSMQFDVDSDPGLMAAIGIRSLPTVVAYRDGRAVASTTGVRSRQAFEAFYQSAIDPAGYRPSGLAP